MDVERFGSLLANAGMILMQLEVPLETVVYVAEMGYRKKIPVMLDPAPARELPPKLLLQLSWLTPNESETLALCGSSPDHGPGSLPLDPTHVRQHAEDLLGRGPRHVILKLGSQGAYLASRNGERHSRCVQLIQLQPETLSMQHLRLRCLRTSRLPRLRVTHRPWQLFP